MTTTRDSAARGPTLPGPPASRVLPSDRPALEPSDRPALEPVDSPAAFLVLDALRRSGSHPVVQSFPQGAIVAFDRDLRYLCAGGPTLTDVGLSGPMMAGRTIYEVLPPAVVAIIEPQVLLAFSGVGSATDVPFGERVFLQRLGPVRDADGTVVAALGVIQDVTDARRAEATLRESEERIRLAFENAPIGIALIAIDGHYEQVNQALCDITGYSAAQMLQMRVADVTHADDLAADDVAREQLLSGDVLTSTMDKRYLTGGGSTRWVTKSWSLMRRDDGTPMHLIAQVQDITERKQHEQVVLEERRRLRAAESIGRLGSWEVDEKSQAVFLSEGLRDLWGIDADGIDADRIDADRIDWDLADVMRGIHPADRRSVRAAVQTCRIDGGVFSVRCRAIRADTGAVRWFDTRGEGLYEDGALKRMVGAVTDVTDQVLAESVAGAAHAFQEAVIGASPDLIFVYDVPNHSTVWTNRSLPELLGYVEREFEGSAVPGAALDVFDRLVPESEREEFDAALAAACTAGDDDVVPYEHSMRHADGTIRWFARHTKALHRAEDGSVDQLVGVLRDITNARVTEARLQHSALHDDLTGLPNRALLLDRLAGALSRSGREGREVAVLFCDLDAFKRVNDTAGHAAGDTVLVETARRLRSVLRAGDTVARVGGDEFVVVVEPWNRHDADDLRLALVDDVDHTPEQGDRIWTTGLAERVIQALRQPIAVNGIEHVVSASIGITYGTAERAGNSCRSTPDQLLQDADAAMYRAKSRGRDRYEVFEDAMRVHLLERGRVEHVLRQALRSAITPSTAPLAELPGKLRPQFLPAYQPVFDSGSGALVGFEALARLSDADGRDIVPDVFITIAEEIGLIGPLGTLMLEAACGQLAAWRAETPGMEAVTMAVNVSGLQAQDESLGDDVRRILEMCGLAPHDLVLELTETALLQAAASTIAALQVLHDEGVGIAIDDFGTGYASLRYLATLPVSALKIDKSFTAGLPEDKTSTKIVFAVAGLAADLNMACVVEGVETTSQRDALPDGVHIQGWLTGRPLLAHLLDLPDLMDRGVGRRR